DYVSSGITPPNDLALAYRLYLKNLERQEEKESLRYGVLLDSIAQEYHTWYQRTFFTDYQLGELNSVYLQDIYRTYSSLKEQTLFKKEQLEELTIVPDAVGKPATKALTTLIFLPWDVARADMEALQLATDKERYPLYLSFKKKYLWMPGFYAEAAQVFWEKGNKELALRVLSNLLEIEQDNISWIRYISHSLLRMNLPAYAFPLLQKAFKARPHDPQSYRDLARCHTALGNNQQAVNLLAEALRRNWGSSYVGLKAILMSELNHLIITSEYPLAVDDIPEVIKEGKVLDLRIVVEWLGTHFPMDVWVIEPTHEKAYYGNKLTKIGGLFSDNKQNQYGIEQYIIKEAIEGQYDVKLDYAPPTGITLFPPAALVNIYKDYGSVHESNSQQYIQLPKEERLVAASSVIYQVGNVSTAARYNSIQLAQEVHDFSFYQQGKGIISMNVHEVALWDLPSEQHEVLFQELEEGEFVFKQLAVSPSQQYLVVWLDSLVQQPEASGEMIDEWGVNDYVPILKVFDLTEKQNLRTLLLPQSISFVGCLNGGDVIYATAEGLFQLSENESSAYLRWPFNHPVQKIVEQNGLIGISTTDELTIINATDWSLKATIPIKGIQSFSLNQDQFAYYANNELFIRHYQGSTKSIAWQKYDEESVIEQLLLSPDGKLLAIHPLTSNQVIVLDTKTGSRIISYFHTKTVKAIRFSADGSLLASASGANDIRVRNIKTLPSTAFKLSESKGVKFEVAAADGKVYIVKKKGISTLEVSADGSIEYSPEKLGENLSISPTYFKLLSSKKRKWMVYAYNNASGFTLGQITLKGRWNQKEQLLTDWMEKFDFSHTTQIAIPNKQNIIVFDKGKSLQVLSLNKLQAYQAGKDGDETTYFSEQCVHQLTNSHILNEFQTIAVSEDGKYIAANEKEHIYIWNADGKLLEIIEAPHASAMLKFGHKDRYLFFEGEDHTLMKWDWRTSKQVMAFQGHRNKLTGFAQHENGYILTASADHTIKLWNQSGQLLKTFFGKAPNQIAFYSENLFVSANEDAELKFWQWDGKQD
ncbi:MAG: tetratricopeptide repeat protein, partial [Flammeovirgaceae bacterium]